MRLGLMGRLDWIRTGIAMGISIVDAEIAEVQRKIVDADYEYRQKHPSKSMIMRQQAEQFKETAKENFGVDIDFDKDTVGDWLEDFSFMTGLIEKIVNAAKAATDSGFNENSELDDDDVKKFLEYIADEDIQNHVREFDRKYSVPGNSFPLTSIIANCNEILYLNYPGYDKMYKDKEEELRKFNTEVISERLKGKDAGNTRKLMVKVTKPEDVNGGGMQPKPIVHEPEENIYETVQINMPKAGEAAAILGGSYVDSVIPSSGVVKSKSTNMSAKEDDNMVAQRQKAAKDLADKMMSGTLKSHSTSK